MMASSRDSMSTVECVLCTGRGVRHILFVLAVAHVCEYSIMA